MLRRIQTISAVIALAAASLALGACEDPKPTPPPMTSAKPVATMAAPTATAMAPAPTSTAAAAAGKMANCPSAVEGAATDIKDIEGGVEVAITAKTEAATKDIRARAKALAEAAKTDSANRKHTGTGEGGGALGRCPVVMRDVTLDLSDIEGGTKVVVKIKEAAQLDWLRRESRERLAELATPGAKEAGQGKMAHCPSAVDGSKTVVKKAADTVVVTVTATGDAKVKDVRDRAKHLVEASKAEGAGKHTGDGTGGGGFGRCPVVLENTTVTAKDVEGGSELTVKPKDKAGLDALAKDAEERAKNFGSATAPAGTAAAPAAGTAAPAAGTTAPKK